MFKNPLFLVIFFYALVLLQTSFLVHFRMFGMVLNLVLISIIVINFLEKPNSHSGYFAALIGGFFLDIFSENFIGFWILILMAITIFIKLFLRQHVLLPKFE